MDLIYADERKIDIGTIPDYTLDLAFGADENDFECAVCLDNHVCREGYYLYIEGTEYGGIVDRVRVDTESETIIYGGRTWHGILAGKVVEPEPGEDYLVLSGEANTVLRKLIQAAGLQGTFKVSVKDSGIEVVDYEVRYKDLYTCIRKMLAAATGKLKIRYAGNMPELSAVPYIDYSQDEGWDSSQVNFAVERNYRPVNHLICLGTGNLSKRHVIHLFTDESGGVQPYATRDAPVQDADYILDKSKQILFGEEEAAEVYDYSNAEDTENYILLTSQPKNWAKKYADYYMQNDDDEYVSVEATVETVYTALTSRPSDWAKKYAGYFTKNGSTYKAVEGIAAESYRKQTRKPADWGKNYENYYYYYSDGVVSEYKKVSGNKKYKYLVQTQKPTDWNEKYDNYYKKKVDAAGYEKVTLTLAGKVPTWKPKKFYTQQNYSVAPPWEAGKYYTRKETTSAPTWAAGSYYSESTDTVAPSWAPNIYFAKKVDHYAELVQGGLERLAKSYQCDKISIALDPEQAYDIGDIVGASEHVTGISIWQPITKKIVKIDSGKEEVEYEIGE